MKDSLDRVITRLHKIYMAPLGVKKTQIYNATALQPRQLLYQMIIDYYVDLNIMGEINLYYLQIVNQVIVLALNDSWKSSSREHDNFVNMTLIIVIITIQIHEPY